MRLHTADMFDAAQKHLYNFAAENGVHPLIVIDDAEGLRVETLDLLRRLTAYELDAEDRFSILIFATEGILPNRCARVSPMSKHFALSPWRTPTTTCVFTCNMLAPR